MKRDMGGKMDDETASLQMSKAIQAIAEEKLHPEEWIDDCAGFGLKFQLADGLRAGMQITEKVTADKQRESVEKAYKALGARGPSSWVKADICADLLELLLKRQPSEPSAKRTHPWAATGGDKEPTRMQQRRARRCAP